jgi:hypothetical protein
MIPGITASRIPGGGGTAPAIRSEVVISFSAATTHTPTMPPSISTGDLIVVCLGFSIAPTVTIDTGFSGGGWTVERDNAGTNCKVWVASKIATGSDALRINVGSSSTCAGASFSVQNGTVLRSAGQAFAAPGSDTANPPAVSGLSNGADAVCFVVFSANGGVTTGSAPSGYALVTQVSLSGAVQLFKATKTISGTSEDPAAYPPGGNTAHVIATVVITLA